jgi:hypothetical protein
MKNLILGNDYYEEVRKRALKDVKEAKEKMNITIEKELYEMIPIKQSIAFSGHKEEWDNFRLICKLQDKNASKELRRFINNYIDNNIDLLIEYNKQQEEQRNPFNSLNEMK